jgi:hypothetical protein
MTDATPSPQAAQSRSATEHFKEVSFEIQGIVQAYISGGVENEDMRNAIRSVLALASGLTQVLSLALQPRQ